MKLVVGVSGVAVMKARRRTKRMRPSRSSGSIAPPGAIDPDDLEGRMRFVRLRAFITATPETPTTSFMFYIQSRNFAVDNVPLTGRLMTDFRRVFDQDVAVMEGQQRASDAWPDAPTIDINVDAPPLAMRRLMRQLIASENGAAAA